MNLSLKQPEVQGAVVAAGAVPLLVAMLSETATEPESAIDGTSTYIAQYMYTCIYIDADACISAHV